MANPQGSVSNANVINGQIVDHQRGVTVDEESCDSECLHALRSETSTDLVHQLSSKGRIEFRVAIPAAAAGCSERAGRHAIEVEESVHGHFCDHFHLGG